MSGKRLVRGDDQGRPVGNGDDVGHREGLAGSGHPQQHLVPQAAGKTVHETANRFRLVPRGGKRQLQMKPLLQRVTPLGIRNNFV